MRGDPNMDMAIDPKPLHCKHGHDHATPEGARACQHAEDAWVRIAAENASDANLRLAAVVAQRDQLRAALVGLVGVDGGDDLAQMEVIMRAMPAPAEDRAATVDAIHALIATLPK